MKILLIDDNEDMRRSIENYLSARFNASVTSVSKGRLGKNAGDSSLAPIWDVIAIDRVLDDRGTGLDSGDGLAVAAIFRQDDNYSQTLIIVYSRGEWITDEEVLRRYSESGIFISPNAIGPVIENIIAVNLGKGPWTWTLSNR